MRINGLDLFSGIGGIALALHPWVQTVAYCEIEKYPTLRTRYGATPNSVVM